MRVITLDRDVPETWLLGPAVEAVRKGQLIVFPTDSVYALGCDPFDRKAVDKLYNAKGMTENHRCSVICGDIKQVASVARGVSDAAFQFMRRHMPGAYTILLKASRDLPKEATGKRKQIGVRMPDHPVALALVEELGKPMLVTSVPLWLSGEMIDPVEIAERLAVRPAIVIDQGPQIADPSTVIDFSVDPPELVRLGKGPVDWIEG